MKIYIYYSYLRIVLAVNVPSCHQRTLATNKVHSAQGNEMIIQELLLIYNDNIQKK